MTRDEVPACLAASRQANGLVAKVGATMADTPNARALRKAAKRGDAATIRELIAAGAPIETTDENKRTPAMLAAQAGHVEAFRTLVEAGANLHALALSDTDLIGDAAEGGAVEILRFLIDQGHPIEGHWQPRSGYQERMGYITPLMSAAINGHAEAVRVLLEAGANRQARFDGETALTMVKESIKHPLDDDGAAMRPQYEAIAALLSHEPIVGKEPADEIAAREVGNFATNSRRLEYTELRRKLTEESGEPRFWAPVPDHGAPAEAVVSFTLVGCKSQKKLDSLQARARDAACHLVLTEPWTSGETATLILFPTDDKFAVVAAVGTEGANHGVQTPDVIAWLKELDSRNPFHLNICSHEAVGGAFASPAVMDVKNLAERIVEFCPSSLDDDVDDVETLALVLKKGKRFFLRWD